MALELRTLGASGEVLLRKKYAGRKVAVDEIESGVWIVKTAQVIPDNELWLHEPAVARKLDRAIARAERTKPRETNWEEFQAKVQAKLGPLPRRQRRK